MESQSAAIQACELTKRFGAFTAVDHVSFEVRRGELFGLLGPNGAGKTTLIKILCGLTDADSGDVRLFGRPFHKSDRDLRRSIGIGTQDLSIYPELSARDGPAHAALY